MMDTLSTSVSTFRLSGHHHLPKFPHLKTHFPPILLISPTTNFKQPPTKTAHSNNLTNPPPLALNSSPQSTNPPPKQHPKPQLYRNPATGYAVSLLDFAKSHAALDRVNRDVRRLSKWLGRQEIKSVISSAVLVKGGKGELLKEMVRRGKFQKYLEKLVNLLVGKRECEVDMVVDVLKEFSRIYEELIIGGSQGPVALVSPGVKIGKYQNFGVAERIRQISGEVKVISGSEEVGWRGKSILLIDYCCDV